MAKVCPGQKSATLIYDACQLRHSNASFFGAVEASMVVWLANSQNATQQEQFTALLGALMGNVTGRTAYSSLRMFAVGSAAVTPFVNVYGMAQCTRDLAGDDCNRCLAGAVSFIPNCCDGRQGARIVYPSCSIRFEVYPFYNLQAAEAAMSPAPAPSPGGGSVNGSDQSGQGKSGSNHTVRTALLVAISVAVALLLVAIFLFLCKRNREPHKHVQVASTGYGDEEDMRSSESLLYDLSTLRAATQCRP
ncbi:cysteine-rich receptor-like protein kinase 25 [Miscanthus floridulus]|uniref:cysteine-rich receptor-like protein kinase 25 n=1 Tax=Miscanthus floridulus TaxID=154761 RepID=UPI00345833BA